MFLHVLAWIILGSAAATASYAQASPTSANQHASVSDEVALRQLENDWAEAFRRKDLSRLEQIVAPEFRVTRVTPERVGTTHRARWMENTAAWTWVAYDQRVIDVLVVRDTAVVTVEGSWRIQRPGSTPGAPLLRDERFLLTDTFVRRNGSWQVIHRHSTPRPAVPQKRD